MFSNELQLYQRSNNFIWTDEYIANNMLAAHLNLDIDAASRNIRTIEKTIEWITKKVPKNGRILDLGCGPGLYASILAKKGYSVTGIDISQKSIAYARKKAIEEKLQVNYLCADYLKDDFGTGYDAVICIYCDFGALTPEEQLVLLKKIHNSLLDEGIFIFDVFKSGLCDTMQENKHWSYSHQGGFWSGDSHFSLEETKHFTDQRAWGSRTIIIEEGKSPREYITWDTYYTEDEINQILYDNGFEILSFNNKLIDINEFTSNDVMFIEAKRREC